MTREIIIEMTDIYNEKLKKNIPYISTQITDGDLLTWAKKVVGLTTNDFNQVKKVDTTILV